MVITLKNQIEIMEMRFGLNMRPFEIQLKTGFTRTQIDRTLAKYNDGPDVPIVMQQRPKWFEITGTNYRINEDGVVITNRNEVRKRNPRHDGIVLMIDKRSYYFKIEYLIKKYVK